LDCTRRISKESPASKLVTPKIPKKILKGFTTEEVKLMIDAFSNKNYFEARNKTFIAVLSDCGKRIEGITNC